MQQIYIPNERMKAIKKDTSIIRSVSKACDCKINIAEDDMIEINGKDSFSEFTARNIIYAYGRGFEPRIALMLTNPDKYFKVIDIDDIISNEKRVKQIKARIIGENGRTKRYIEEVSAAHISVYGDTVSIIGNIEQISEAETAVNTLIEGGTHKLAYIRMEAQHRKNKAASLSARF